MVELTEQVLINEANSAQTRLDEKNTSNLVKFVTIKRNTAIAKVLTDFADDVAGISPERWCYMEGQVVYTAQQFHEFMVWDELNREYYWRSLHHVKTCLQKDQNCFSEDDLRTITELMVMQAIEGKNVAQQVPIYSDVWNLFEETPLEKYVTEKHKRNAVNTGFWELLKQTNNTLERHINDELFKILAKEDFLGLIDYGGGILKLHELPEKKDFGILQTPKAADIYLRWYMVQEVFLKNLHKKSKIAGHNDLARSDVSELCGKIAAPLVYFALDALWSEDELYNSRGDKLLYVLSTLFSQKLFRSKAVQHVLGTFYEDSIEAALQHPGDYYAAKKVIKATEKFLIDAEERAKKPYQRLKEKIKLSGLPEELKKYVPEESKKEYVHSLKQKIDEMVEFDSKLFGKWLELEKGTDVAAAEHSRIRNKALEIYFNQKTRPRREVLSNLDHFVQGRYCPRPGNDALKDHLLDQLNAYLTADFLRARGWSQANRIVMSYEKATTLQRTHYNHALSDYAKQHCSGKIKVGKKALEIDACKPDYNVLPDFLSRFPSLFGHLQKY